MMLQKVTTLEEAREAKKSFQALFKKVREVVGIGITSQNGSYMLKVNLSVDRASMIPSEIKGVKIVTEVVGQIKSSDKGIE